MTTLITGGTGMLGVKIAKQLIKSEKPVLFDASPAYTRLESLKDKVSVVQGNITNLNEILLTIQKYKIRKIIHLASLLSTESNNNPLVATNVNIMGTINVFEAARIMNLERVCIASSIAVYGVDEEYKDTELPVTEDAHPLLAKGIPVYSAGKLYMESLGDLYREKYGVFVCGLRPAMVYGRGRKTGNSAFLSNLIERPIKGLPVKVENANARVSMVYIDDVVDQWLSILGSDKKKFKHFYYNSGADTATVGEIADIVKSIIPEANININYNNNDKDVGGIISRISDKFIQEELGVKRKYSPIELGIKQMIKEIKNEQRY